MDKEPFVLRCPSEKAGTIQNAFRYRKLRAEPRDAEPRDAEVFGIVVGPTHGSETIDSRLYSARAVSYTFGIRAKVENYFLRFFRSFLPFFFTPGETATSAKDSVKNGRRVEVSLRVGRCFLSNPGR